MLTEPKNQDQSKNHKSTTIKGLEELPKWKALTENAIAGLKMSQNYMKNLYLD